MDETLTRALAAVAAQQPEARGPVWMAGEQLKDILRASPCLAPVVLADLAEDAEALSRCERKIRDFARGHGGCCTGDEADRILREHFGLGEAPAGTGDPAAAPGGGSLVDLDSFLNGGGL